MFFFTNIWHPLYLQFHTLTVCCSWVILMLVGAQLGNKSYTCMPGSTVANTAHLAVEIGKLRTYLWSFERSYMEQEESFMRYKGRRLRVLSILLHGSETWPTYVRQESHNPDVKVPDICGSTTCSPFDTTLHLQWQGHVCRRDDLCITILLHFGTNITYCIH